MPKKKTQQPQTGSLKPFVFAKTTVLAGSNNDSEIVALTPIIENLGIDRKKALEELNRVHDAGKANVLIIAKSPEGEDTLCLPVYEFQDWLWDLHSEETNNPELLENYRKGLAVFLVKQVQPSADDFNEIKGVANEYGILKNIVTQYINANEQGKEYTRKAKTFFKESNELQKKITERMGNVNLDQLKMFS